MKITIDLLKEWGACERALVWFEKTYPAGVTDTLPGLLARIPADWEYDGLWLLHEVAARVDGVEGDEALALLVERADGSRLAKAVTEITRRDTGAALTRLLQVGDAITLIPVMLSGCEAAAQAFAAKATPALADYVARESEVWRGV